MLQQREPQRPDRVSVQLRALLLPAAIFICSCGGLQISGSIPTPLGDLPMNLAATPRQTPPPAAPPPSMASQPQPLVLPSQEATPAVAAAPPPEPLAVETPRLAESQPTPASPTPILTSSPVEAKATAPEVSTTPPTSEPSETVEPAPPVKHYVETPAEKARKARRNEREAERRKKREEDAVREVELRKQTDEVFEKAKAKRCGDAPKPSAWDGIPYGLKDAYAENADDPGSVEFTSCTEPRLGSYMQCWLVVCKVREKNRLGGKYLHLAAFSKSSDGWREMTVEK